MTALAAPASTNRYLPAVNGGVDRAIRISTAAVVLTVAGIAAYISYWHAYAVVREYGETGVTAQLEPATIDGLVYASSMVILYAARHRLPVPPLARWMLALGIVASLAVNVAQGWSHGLVGAVVAAWPAVSLVGSYELLAWIIRTAATGGPDHVPAADHHRPVPDHTGTGPWPAPGPVPDTGPANRYEQVTGLAPVIWDNPLSQVPAAFADTRTGAGLNVPDHPDHPDQAADHGDQVPGGPPAAGNGSGEIDINAAPTVPASRMASRSPSGSLRRCSARPPVAGRAAGWPKPADTWHQSKRRPPHEGPRRPATGLRCLVMFSDLCGVALYPSLVWGCDVIGLAGRVMVAAVVFMVTRKRDGGSCCRRLGLRSRRCRCRELPPASAPGEHRRRSPAAT